MALPVQAKRWCRAAIAASLTLACLAIANEARAETPAPVLLVVAGATPVLNPGPLRMAHARTLQVLQAAPLPGKERSAQIGRLKTLEALSVLGVAGIAATLGLMTGGVSYAVVAGGAVLLTYSLLP